jgi:hypothetical protein
LLLRLTRTLAGWVLTLLAAAFVYVALVVPDTIGKAKNGSYLDAAFVRLPLELIVGGAVLLALAPRWRKWAAMLGGLGLGVVVILKVANIGFRIVLGRAFNPVLDWPLFHDGYNALTETDGRATAIGAAIGAVVAALLALVVCTLAVLRLTKLTARYPGPARRTLVALSAAWIALAISGITWFPNAPAASDTAAALLKTTVTQVPAAIRDQHQFAYAAAHDPYRAVPPQDLVSGLTGKDVVIGVVESYGRSALTDPGMKAIVDPVLRSDEQKLASAGFAARTGWLTSSTYGGGSWFAHATFQSGLWITNQQRYRQLAASDRITLTNTFHKAGWQTVGMEPGNTVAWPEASYYGYDSVYDSRNLGYKGPKFGWSSMPDQYTLSAFQNNVYAKRTGPLMAEITLTSSHEPWTPIPRTVDWNAIGDGSIYKPMAKGAESRTSLWGSAARTQTQYAKSIGYSVDNLITWAQKYGGKNLVLIMFGDHQPMSIVSGNGASHDVPVTVIAHDKSVLERIADWHWADGLRPTASTPVWRMDQFRDKFFAAYGKQNAIALSAPH